MFSASIAALFSLLLYSYINYSALVKVFTTILFIGFSSLLFGSTSTIKIDSLTRANDSLRELSNSAERFAVYSKLIKEYTKLKDTANIIHSTIQMADMSRSAGSHLIAINILDELEHSGYTLSQDNIIEISLTKGATLFEISERDSSIVLARKGLENGRKFNLNKYAPLLCNLLGASYLNIDFDSSEKYLNQSVNGFLDLNDTVGAVLPYLNLFRLYYFQNDFENGLKILHRSIAILDIHDVPVYRKMAYANYAIIYKSLRKFEESVTYLNLRDSVNQRINNNQITFQISQFQERLEEESNNARLMALHSKIEMKELENKTNKVILTFSLILIIALGMSLFFALKSSRDRKKVNTLMHKKTAELEDINQFKNQILSVISHDMRSPLAQVITFQHAKNSGINFSPEELKEMDKTILASTKNGLLVLDNLLKWATSQFSDDVIKIESFDSKFVITQILNQVSELSKEKEIEIYSNIADVEVYSNESLFQIILRNLLYNAIKFSPAHSEIRVSSRVVEENLEVKILDQGYGIPDKVLQALEEGEQIKPKNGKLWEKRELELDFLFQKNLRNALMPHFSSHPICWLERR